MTDGQWLEKYMIEEYKDLRDEIKMNSRFVFERPLVIAAAILAGLYHGNDDWVKFCCSPFLLSWFSYLIYGLHSTGSPVARVSSATFECCMKIAREIAGSGGSGH